MARDRAARPEAKPLRLFVAIEIPDAVKDVVEEAFAPWREAFPEARWVPRENMHVTLKFLGRTWPRLTDWVPERVGAAASQASGFPARLRGVGSFPSAKRGRALWAAFEDQEGIAALAAGIESALVDEFPAEKRAVPSAPHGGALGSTAEASVGVHGDGARVRGVGGRPRRAVPEPPRSARAPIRAPGPLPDSGPHELAFEHLFD